ncbi:hypothetical protein QC761_504180 [Podospora bellae-mahoneyi]|uniref:Ankyrin repeat protein n=1 Tax=Podospora bellae-mahoneyi TaxID=2093777 RepID=A0ABR0FCX6_9PEZI|nr:hypothetical protein QC761_504180 [Podospora bellae-mahoneyi]
MGGHRDAAEVLLSCGADPEPRSLLYSTPLTLLIWQRGKKDRDESMGIIQLLLEKGADPNGADDDGDTSLISCSVFQQVEVTQLLLKHGAQVDVANNDGKKAIHAAAAECDPRMIRLLLDHGANPAQKEIDGWKALHMAAQMDKKETLEVVKVLVDTRRIEINNQEEKGTTALYLAVQAGRPDVAQVLLEAGADPNITAKPDFWPLRRAVLTSNMELLNLLLSHGADVSLSDSKGRNVHFACAQSDANILKRVVEASLDALPQQRDDNGGTPLHVAVQNDYEVIALALMELGGASKRQRAE